MGELRHFYYKLHCQCKLILRLVSECRYNNIMSTRSKLKMKLIYFVLISSQLNCKKLFAVQFSPVPNIWDMQITDVVCHKLATFDLPFQRYIYICPYLSTEPSAADMQIWSDGGGASRDDDECHTHNCHLRRLHWMQMFMNMAREEVEGQPTCGRRRMTD